jgi:hypothetical protein
MRACGVWALITMAFLKFQRFKAVLVHSPLKVVAL